MPKSQRPVRVVPLIVIAIAIAGFVFGREAVTGQVALSIKDMLGDTGAKAVQAMLVDASRPKEGLLATSLGIGALLFAAIGVVVELKDALNIVWEKHREMGYGTTFEATFYRSPGYYRLASCFWSRYL
jgi:membrane protein